MKVGVIGLGNMGTQIAMAINRAGFDTYVYDIRPEAAAKLVEQGAHSVSSIKELAQQADVVGVVVLNEQQVSEVAVEVASAGLSRTLVIHSTVTPMFVQALSERLAPHQVAVVDAAVAGGVARARTGDLTVMVGGDDDVVADLSGIFDAIGRDVFHAGRAGAGSAMKLAVNFMTIASFALQTEAMEFVRAYGITEDALSSVLTTSSADSRAVRTWGFHDRLRRTAAPGTAPAHEVMHKDISSFATAGGRAGLLLPLATVAAETLLGKVAERDRYLDSLGDVTPIPRCTVCSLELIPPFREAGVHPECARA
ncbi:MULTISPECIES: NAD(P)-dependent oxidoreductase [unclassified Streptomyces]|uniref:NAD(P)-dependent oxidoreductase n=1 Tax=unclassified Streptomyces TaxID=2593676 RepID=UPI00081F66A3|nr:MULTISPECIES: NAD(P)-dependent oxidoreductase [unclassified Streptomyces]SCF67470.1 3-hydroxyisobutyrate dehydrogenase/2-hydroxy-3-oxopropionate reductase [Streptomyces sp. MnatMP-M17]